MHFLQSLAVNFGIDGQFRCKVSVLVNGSGVPPERHHNFPLLQFMFWKVPPSSWSRHRVDCLISRSIPHHVSFFDKETDHSNFTNTASNTFQNIELDVHWLHVDPIHWISSFCQFSGDTLILWKCRHSLSETFLCLLSLF